jgi:hypothetical protein
MSRETAVSDVLSYVQQPSARMVKSREQCLPFAQVFVNATQSAAPLLQGPPALPLDPPVLLPDVPPLPPDPPSGLQIPLELLLDAPPLPPALLLDPPALLLDPLELLLDPLELLPGVPALPPDPPVLPPDPPVLPPDPPPLEPSTRGNDGWSGYVSRLSIVNDSFVPEK